MTEAPRNVPSFDPARVPGPRSVPSRSAEPRLEQRIEIETPEQVVFGYTVAGIGSRGAAAILDVLLLTIITLVLWVGFGVLVSAIPVIGTAVGSVASWAFAAVILLQFALMWGYFVFFEALWDGQTPGKRRMGIRVVQDGGYSVSFAASAVRNLVRIVDMQPGFSYAVGIVAAATSRTGKRLGDILAGTMVVHERVLQAPTVEARGGPADNALPSSLAAALAAALTEPEYELLGRFLARRGSLDADRRRALTEQLSERFAAHLTGEGKTPLAQLLELHDREQNARKHGVAARGNTGAAREEHSIVARSLPRWSEFAARLSEAQRRGLRNMSEEDVSEFVALYREVSTDFARLKTASRGREPEALFYVSRLVGAGHNLLYRQRPLVFARLLRFFAVTVPTEMRQSAVPILLAAICLFGPMLVTYAAILDDPALTEELLPPMMLDRAEEGVKRAREGKGYVTVSDFERPPFASSIIANNVQISFFAFALGITAGLGTIYLLLFNGVSIGAGFGLYASKGILPLIMAFVMPHGVFELTAICLAGGAGLLVGSAFLIPGDRTRREALVIRARRGIRLIAGATLFLLVAGIIEGLISPRTDVPMWVRGGIAGASAMLIALYVAFGRGAPDDAAEHFAYSDARAFTSR
jgi:uncharacterized membrane protein SpoIIM required for sporulation/uncharacterized RDD family membrane protein YckC